MAQSPLSHSREGHGPHLVLFHGGVGSRNHWHRNIPGLSNHFNVFAVDLPGFGASADVRDDISTDAYLSLVADEAHALWGPKFRLAAFSFGAVVAAVIAARLGHMIECLTLIAPGGFGVPKGRQLDLRPVPRGGLDSTAGRAALQHNLRVTMFAYPDTAQAEAVEFHRSNIERARFDSRRISLQDRLIDDLTATKCPLQLIWGERDALAYPSIAGRVDRIQAVRPDARVDLIADAGHWVQYERPAETNRTMLDFMLSAALEADLASASRN